MKKYLSIFGYGPDELNKRKLFRICLPLSLTQS